MAKVCWCKLYGSEEDATASGMNYYNANANPKREFSYKARQIDGKWELKVCFQYDENLSWSLEQAGFRPCQGDGQMP